MTSRNITPDMIRAGARFNAFSVDGKPLGKRIVVHRGEGLFILITENFMGGLCGDYYADNLAAEMTRMNAYEPVSML